MSQLKFIFIGVTLGIFANSGYCKNILDLQSHLKTDRHEFDINGDKTKIALTSLNKNINTWFLLEVKIGSNKYAVHLENPDPTHTQIELIKEQKISLQLTQKDSKKVCEIKEEDLKYKSKENDPYYPICDKGLYIRLKTEGRESAKEAVADFLRNNVWGGEKITSFVKDVFFKDKYKIESDDKSQNKKDGHINMNDLSPNPANLSEEGKGKQINNQMLGLPIENPQTDTMQNGEWYKLKGKSDIFVSVIEPGTIDKTILGSFPKNTTKLDDVESKALAFSIAFDLDQYDLGFVLGTDHPDVKWAERALDEVKDNTIPGPDGIGTIEPLVATGKLSPYLLDRVVSTFTGGFKRGHSAFKWGTLAKINGGSHYGFIEQGVVLSKLQPGLATLIIKKDGEISMKTWQDSDNFAILGDILHARQNGVPIIDGIDETSKLPIPGELVNKWGAGNWSGSANGKQRSLRAGTCIAENNAGKKFFIYSYFSTITPSGMARVFQSFGCNYAMHMDMNALEHTYLATYDISDKDFITSNFIQGMEVLDSKHQGKTLPRFVGMADNRDFFYVVKKNNNQK